ncbi:MAG: hypothetical protein DRH50_03880 [Deltaproteobacteria bacterium]|nr:MAG: hypothetical protein DRH50_03880 [Deltaproteobacteria bacterium]
MDKVLTHMTEDTVERTSLALYESFGYDIVHGLEIAFDGPFLERDTEANSTDTVLVDQLSSALDHIKRALSKDALLPKSILNERGIPDAEVLLDGLNIHGGQHG